MMTEAQFMNKVWDNGQGAVIAGRKNGNEFVGVVTEVRTARGDDLKLEVLTEAGDLLILRASEVYKGQGICYSDLEILM